MNRPCFRALATAALFLVSACSRAAPTETRTARVFTAASLTAAFEKLGKEFEASHPGTKIELNFAGTPQLVTQVKEGAAADVFASADVPNLQKLVEAKRTTSEPKTFAQNRLAIVVGKGNPKRVASLADLAKPELKVLLCGPEVPAGKYARQAFEKAKVAAKSLSDEPNVKAVATKVGMGEADAGVVYVTDVPKDDPKIEAVAIPDAVNVVATYPIATLNTGTNGALGAEFVAFVLSPDGQRVLHSFGFQSAP